ncbi:MAG: hypothetical protein PHX37_04810 [Eubacteriales bacterium]|nr:hypothetical protein [Eubacteriales bacterium]
MPLIRVFYGPKGTGKTRAMVDAANDLSARSKGDIVYVHNSDELIYHLKQKIRFTNADDYPVHNIQSMLGFICGILSQNFDIEAVFIDSLSYIVKTDLNEMAILLGELERVADANGIDLYISLSGEAKELPEQINKHIAKDFQGSC